MCESPVHVCAEQMKFDAILRTTDNPGEVCLYRAEAAVGNVAGIGECRPLRVEVRQAEEIQQRQLLDEHPLGGESLAVGMRHDTCREGEALPVPSKLLIRSFADPVPRMIEQETYGCSARGLICEPLEVFDGEIGHFRDEHRSVQFSRLRGSRLKSR